jgi:acetyl-CoA carboxylase biotin carboxyl carrier protein
MTTSGAAAGRAATKAGSRRGDSGAHRAAGSQATGPAAEPHETDRESDDSMNVDAIKQILDLVREHELTEFELEQGGVKLRVRKQGATPAPGPMVPAVAPLPAPAPAPPVAAAPTAVPAVSPAAADEPLELSVVTSPIVGTFYRSPDPSSPSFVEVGQRVKKGQTLCIIEAMKLMNEIESEYEGEIVKVYVENGQPVQYGERLFAVKTT